MASFLDVCRFTPTAGGTTDWTVSAAVTGYQTPASAGAVNAAVYRYRAESSDLSQWEVGYGAYTVAGTVLARTTVLFNSSGTTSKISFSVAPQVAIVCLAEDLGALAVGQIPGTTTNDDATAGNVGESYSHTIDLASSAVTVTSASPGVVSWTAHGKLIGAPITFTGTTAPTGMALNTTYYICSASFGANSFTLSTTLANAFAGTAINTTSTGTALTANNYALLANTTPKSIAGLQLTAGDWEVFGGAFWALSGASATTIYGGFNTTADTIGAIGSAVQLAFPSAASGNNAAAVPVSRFKLSATTIVHFVERADYSGGSVLGCGSFHARRMR